MTISWPDNLVNDIARRRCVLFLGSGISQNSTNMAGIHPKTWKELLLAGITRIPKQFHSCIKKHIAANNYLMACELLKRLIGRDDFVDFLRAEYMTPRFNPAEIHKKIFELDLRIIATPNFDNIYDVYAQHETAGTTSIKRYYDDDVADIIRKSDRLILKIHGDIQTPDKLIFSKIDYAHARNTYTHFYKILEALMLTHTFIFLGAGLNDPDISLLLEDYNFRYSFTRKHYFIIPKKTLTPEEREIYTGSMGLQFLEYDSKLGHKELLDSITELVPKVEEERKKIAGSNNW